MGRPPFRLAAFDLDGTLLSGPSAMSDANAAALRALVERGVVVAPATARPYRAAVAPFAGAGLEPVPAVSAAGADVRAADGRAIFQRALSPEGAAFAYDVLSRAGWSATVATPGVTYRVEATLPAWAANPPPGVAAVGSCAEIPGGEALCILARATPDDPWLARLEVRRDVLNVHMALHHDGSGLVTITAAGVDKGSGLAALCGDLGITPAEAIAFGDSDVDIPMFRLAGWAVAMESAAPEVREEAMHLAPAGADGVARALARLDPGT